MQRKITYLVLITILIIVYISGCSYVKTVRFPSEHTENSSADAMNHYSLGVLLRLEGKIDGSDYRIGEGCRR